MFTEGFTSAIRAVADADADGDGGEEDLARNRARNSVLLLKFRGIPDGVTVMASPGGTGTCH